MSRADAAVAFSQRSPEWNTVGLDELLRDARTNALIGWGAAVCVVIAAALDFALSPSIWGGYALLFLVVIALPAVVSRDWTTMAHWPLILVASVAVVVKLGGLFPEATGYTAIVALALVIVVELDTFTSIELSRRFAVFFAVLMATAIEAIWIVVQFVSDRWFGTEYLTTQTALQLDIVAVTAVSLAVGVVFYWYLVRHEQSDPDAGSSGQEVVP